MEDARAKEDTHIKESVIPCGNPNCPSHKRFIKGMGIVYKDQEYCSDPCLEAILNGKSKHIDVPEATIEQLDGSEAPIPDF